MGTLSNAASLAQDSTFRNMALAALVYQARVVIAEDPATAGHADRINYAKAVITDPMRFLDSASWVMAADPQIAALGATAGTIPEATLLTRTLAAWNALAGLFPSSGSV